MTVHEQLVAARNLLARSRWLQREIREPADAEGAEGYCAVGAMLWVTEGKGAASASRAFEAFGEAVGGHPALFNDAPGRTKGEVLTAFDRAIAATAPPPLDPGVPVEAPEAEVVA